MKFNFAFLFLLILNVAFAQDDLLSELESQASDINTEVVGMFKGTRLINGHTVKTKGRGELDMIISHRFGTISSGPYELFGLDNASMRIGFDYGITDKLNVGIGRSSNDKIYDGFIKYNLLSQETGNGGNPFSMTLLAGITEKTTPRLRDFPEFTFVNRIGYSGSIMIARKFGDMFSLQMNPIWVHKNRVTAPETNNAFGVGTGFRVKLTRSLTLNGEYYARLNQRNMDGVYDAISLGFDIETGGHVFQLHLTNSAGMIDRVFLTETYGNWLKGDIYFGFNISRTFQLIK